MRRFSAAYLERTRGGMWGDDRESLADLELETRERILEVGCGTGELTAVLRSETQAPVIACDADQTLLAHLPDDRRLQGDATRLPVRTGAVDLAVCQALLINLPEPADAITEFARVSSDLVAAIEPDNAAVEVESSIEAEERLEKRARDAYLAGVETDVSMGADVAALFEEAGLAVVGQERYDHVREIEPPYSEADVRDARRKATGAGLTDDADEMLAGSLSQLEFDELRSEWRAMGRDVAEAMEAATYRRREVVPFYVTVARVP